MQTDCILINLLGPVVFMQASFFLIETKDSTRYPCTLNARNVDEIQQPLKGCSSSGLVTRVPSPVAPVKAGEWTPQSCFLTCTHVPVSPPHIIHAHMCIHTYPCTNVCVLTPHTHVHTRAHTHVLTHHGAHVRDNFPELSTTL